MAQFDAEITTSLVAHNDRKLPYLKKFKDLKAHEEAREKREKAAAEQARREAEKKFPRTIQEWDNHPTAARKLWLARFLTFSIAEKEENMQKQSPPWTWNEVDPLYNIYKADVCACLTRTSAPC